MQGPERAPLRPRPCANVRITSHTVPVLGKRSRQRFDEDMLGGDTKRFAFAAGENAIPESRHAAAAQIHEDKVPANNSDKGGSKEISAGKVDGVHSNHSGHQIEPLSGFDGIIAVSVGGTQVFVPNNITQLPFDYGTPAPDRAPLSPKPRANVRITRAVTEQVNNIRSRLQFDEGKVRADWKRFALETRKASEAKISVVAR